jgi:hypothetical protein
MVFNICSGPSNFLPPDMAWTEKVLSKKWVLFISYNYSNNAWKTATTFISIKNKIWTKYWYVKTATLFLKEIGKISSLLFQSRFVVFL